jgi:hypothetical protein
MGVFKRPAMIAAIIGAAGVIAAGVTIPSQAATTSGVRYLQEYEGYASFLGPGPSGQLTECSMVLLSAAVSNGSPAYVSGLLENNTSDTCTGWLQHSVNGGAWTDVSPHATLPATKQGLVNYPWSKTDNYYAGPGTRVRACVLIPATPISAADPLCSKSSATLPSSKAAPTDDGTSVFYAHNDQGANVNSGPYTCFAALSSSGTLAKTAASRAGMLLEGFYNCTAWMETSTDKGAVWEQATPTYSLPLSGPRVAWAFPQAIADGTGKLARACVQIAGHAAACTAAW